jgi:dynein heavy chain, axonemal
MKDFELAVNAQAPAEQLSGDELKLIKKNCHLLGVNKFIINPKA